MEERRINVTDPRLLRTLAHPLRLRLLVHLMATGPATASQCAAAVSDSPSNCSYHLRHLARYGLVEPAAEQGPAVPVAGEGAGRTDRRERPWRAAVTGFDIDADPGDPAAVAAETAVRAVGIDEWIRRMRPAALRRVEPGSAWWAARIFSMYALRITPAELTELGAAVDALIRPYIAATRESAPEDARPVRLGIQAFPEQLGDEPAGDGRSGAGR